MKDASPTPHADEQWSAASRDLVAELPDLVVWMRDDGFEIHRVLYNPADWDLPVPRATIVGGRTLRLGAFSDQRRATITVVDDGGQNHVNVMVAAPTW